MRRDSRLCVALHVLLHMHECQRTMTSEELATALGMNAVVLRRTLSALREARILRGDKGHGGGWALAREIDSLTLRDVYQAIGGHSLFFIGPRNDHTRCPIEAAVGRSIVEVLDDAEALVLERLGKISVASLFATGRGRRPKHARKEIHHHV
jgi:DNA-binding IscR family transcriptional regulator